MTDREKAWDAFIKYIKDAAERGGGGSRQMTAAEGSRMLKFDEKWNACAAERRRKALTGCMTVSDADRMGSVSGFGAMACRFGSR